MNESLISSLFRVLCHFVGRLFTVWLNWVIYYLKKGEAWVGGIKTFTIFCSRVLYLTCYLQLSPIYLFLNRMAWNFSHMTCVLYTSVSTDQFWRNLICFPLPITLITVFSKTCFERHLLSSYEPRLVISSKNGLKLLIHHLHDILVSVYWSVFGKCFLFRQNMLIDGGRRHFCN